MMLVRRNPQSALTRKNEIESVQNADHFYPRMIEDIETAAHSIHLQYFIWGRDDFTERLREILAAKVKAGVEVRILYDPLGSQAHVNRRYLRDTKALGIRMAPTSPLWRLHTISYRNHRKITIIDGSIGYTGGMNIGKEHLDGGKEFDFWRDTQMRIYDWLPSAKEPIRDREEINNIVIAAFVYLRCERRWPACVRCAIAVCPRSAAELD